MFFLHSDHILRFLRILPVPSIVYFESDREESITSLPCTDDTAIEVSGSTAVFDSIVHELISDQDESPFPRCEYSVGIEY